MTSLFQPRKKESAVDIVVNSIRSLIFQKKLTPGDKLPIETEIAEGLNVSRSSVREAMKILSALGLIEVKVGNGTYVSEKMNSNVYDSFLFSLLISNPDLKEIVEFRTIMENDIIELIIKHYDENESEREELHKNLDELISLMDTDCSSDILAENDINFHKLLSVASCNLLSERIYNFVIDLFEISIKSTHKTQHGKLSFKTHKAIMDAIDSKDIQKAKKAVADSVITWSNLIDDD
jgi:GntR family transcriptional repressor for pyruvate dehydrogenase complex